MLLESREDYKRFFDVCVSVYLHVRRFSPREKKGEYLVKVSAFTSTLSSLA